MLTPLRNFFIWLFNSLFSILHNPTAPSPPGNDLELENQPPPIHVANQNQNVPVDWKQTAKTAQTVALGGLAVFITLFVEAPRSATTNLSFYTAYITVVLLGLSTSGGLSVYSALMRNGGTQNAAWVQTRLICFIFFFVFVACTLIVFCELPLPDIAFAMVALLISLAFIVLYLMLGSRRQLMAVGEQRNDV